MKLFSHPIPAVARSVRMLTVGVVAAPLFFLPACSGGSEGVGSAGMTGPSAASVDVLEMQIQDVQSVRELTGRARAFAEAEIRPQVTGLIQSRLFTEGQQVSSGDALYQIDASEYRAIVESAEAALNGSEASAAAARETAERFRHLAEINAVSQQDYDEARASMLRAEANIGIDRAALSRARIDLQRTTVRSPIDGQIGRSTVTPGALVTANQSQSLARVLQLDPIYIDLTSASAEVLRWKQDVSEGRILTSAGASDPAVSGANVPVTIRLENGSEYPERGQLGFSEVSVDENAGTVIVRAVVPNSDGLLLPGMFVTASFSAGLYEDVFLVPQRAVQRTPTGDAYVLIATPENTAEQRMVRILESNGNNWIVTSGLNNGDKLIVSGLQSARPGAAVAISAVRDPSEFASPTSTSNR